MKRSIVRAGLIAVILAVSASGQVPFTVQGSQQWQGTGIQVNEGDRIIITASGMVCLETPCTDGSWNDPDGCKPLMPDPCSYIHPAGDINLAPGLSVGSLVGKIGSGTPFQVGSQLNSKSSETGELSLAYNDSWYADNSGQYDALILVHESVPSLTVPGLVVLTLIMLVTAAWIIRTRKCAAVR